MMYGQSNDAGSAMTSLTSLNGLAVLNLDMIPAGLLHQAGIGLLVNDGTNAVLARPDDTPQDARCGVVATMGGMGPSISGVAFGIGPAVSGTVSGGQGSAVVARVYTQSNTQPALLATTQGQGPGAKVQALASGNGIEVSSKSARGAVLYGGAAPLNLVPDAQVSHPISGQAGDVFVDAGSRLWFCTAGGDTATWKRVALI
jgi:hypothetical protein